MELKTVKSITVHSLRSLTDRYLTEQLIDPVYGIENNGSNEIKGRISRRIHEYREEKHQVNADAIGDLELWSQVELIQRSERLLSAT